MFRKKSPANESRQLMTAVLILRRGVELEQRGLDFYRGMLRGAQSDWVRNLANTMIEWETRHKKRFQHYKRKAEKQVALKGLTINNKVPREVLQLLEQDVFVDVKMAEKTGKNVNDRKALELAIGFERNLAIIYTQLRSYVMPSQRKFIDRLIQEEIMHQKKLERIYKDNFR